jgi:protein phosphatase
VKGGRRRISQITDDHSFVEALVASGHITAEQAAIHPMRSVLYRALGQNDISEADLYTRTVEAGDRLVLCSDGLTRHVSPDEIAQIAFSYDEPTDITQTLIDLANQRGGEDNISVVALVIFEDEEVAPLEQLKPLDCEQERGKFASDMYEKTGPIPDIDLDNL